MKYKGPVLIILIAVAITALVLLPKGKFYEEIATIDSPAPDFELKDIKGNVWKLSELRGKVVFISFWATWCTSCAGEIPYKENLNKKMQGRPFQMLGILYKDDYMDAIAYTNKRNILLPTLMSPGDEVPKLYGITGVPESFIIDKQGIIREKVIGPRQWDSPEAIAIIEKWMK